MIRRLTLSDVASCAQLHAEGLPQDFLPSFGRNFLKILHLGMITSPQSICFGMFQRGTLQGLIIGSVDTGALMREIFTSQFLNMLPHILFFLLKNPFKIKFFLQTISYSKKDDTKAELMIIVVDKKFQNKGFGSKLFRQLVKKFKKNDIKSFKIGTLASNKVSNHFYKKLCGNHMYSYTLYDKVWNVYKFTTR